MKKLSKKETLIIVVVISVLVVTGVVLAVVLTMPKPPLKPGDSLLSKVGAYIPNWTPFRAGSGQFPQGWSWGKEVKYVFPEDLDYILYAFIQFDKKGLLNWGLSNSTPIPALPRDDKRGPDTALDTFDHAAMVYLGNTSFNDKLLSVGGYNFSQNTTLWKDLVEDNSDGSAKVKIEALADGLVKVCKFYKFTGIDIDWEYPEDGQQMTTLLDTLCPILAQNKLKVTLALPVNQQKLALFDFSAIDKYIEWYHLMSYDISGNFGSPTDANVFGANTDFAYIQATLTYLFSERNVSPSKVSLGLATYGRCTSFTKERLGDGTPLNPLNKPLTVLDENTCNTYAKTSSDYACYAGFHPDCYAGQFTKQVGYLSFYEIADLLQSTSTTPVVDEGTLSAYAVFKKSLAEGDTRSAPFLGVSFDTVETIRLKTQKALDLKLRGVFLWQLADDDFQNDYPLVSTAISVFKKKALKPQASSTRSLYSLGKCGVNWDEVVSTGVKSCNPLFKNAGVGGGNQSCYGLPTCAAVVPESCLFGTDKYAQVAPGSGMSKLIEDTCGSNVLYANAKYASQFNERIVQPGRVLYCDKTEDKTTPIHVFKPDCSSASDVGSCLSSALPSSIQAGTICLDENVEDCHVVCLSDDDQRKECLVYRADGTGYKVYDPYRLSWRTRSMCSPDTSNTIFCERDNISDYRFKQLDFQGNETLLPITKAKCEECCGK